jgi:predicted nucleic acid-binding protein
VRGLLDTSIFIADEQRRGLNLDHLPREACISIVTIGELLLGVHMATTERVRAQRLETLRLAESEFVPLPIDDAVAAAFAELTAGARRAGRRPKTQDSWIAATAHAHGVVLYTQDTDFDVFPGLDVVLVPG